MPAQAWAEFRPLSRRRTRAQVHPGGPEAPGQGFLQAARPASPARVPQSHGGTCLTRGVTPCPGKQARWGGVHAGTNPALPSESRRPGGGGYWAAAVLSAIGLCAAGAFILYKFKRQGRWPPRWAGEGRPPARLGGSEFAGAAGAGARPAPPGLNPEGGGQPLSAQHASSGPSPLCRATPTPSISPRRRTPRLREVG